MQAIKEIIQDPAFRQGPDWNYRTFRPGEIVVQEGRPSLSMYLVEKGRFQVAGRVELGEGQQAQPALSELEPGDVFGEFSLFEERPRAATVKALTDGLVVELDTAALRQYLEAHPEAGYKVLKALFQLMVGRLGKANELLAYAVSWGLGALPEQS